MKVLKALPFSKAEHEFTTLFLSDIPHGKISKVVSDGIEYEMMWMSGGRLDTVAIVGLHDLTGKEIEFI